MQWTCKKLFWEKSDILLKRKLITFLDKQIYGLEQTLIRVKGNSVLVATTRAEIEGYRHVKEYLGAKD